MAVYTPTKKFGQPGPGAWGYTRTFKDPMPKKKAAKPKQAVRSVLDPLTSLYKRLNSQLLTEPQLQAQARSMLGTQLGSSMDLIREETTRMRADAERRRQMLQGAYMAAAAENQKMAPSVLGGFTSAAAVLGSLAGQATGSVGDAMRRDIGAQNSALAAVGQAPAGDVGAVGTQQGVENMYSGYLPATNLATMGALANQGMLREVGLQRIAGVERPWQEYEETISKLDQSQLSALKEIEAKRPDMLADVLEGLRTNQAKVSGQMIDIEQERADRRQQMAKIQQAQATLNLRYQEAKSKALTSADKAALDRWYKAQQVKLSIARNAISATNAQTSQGRLAVAQQNANTSAIKAANAPKPGEVKPKSVAEVMASLGRSRRDAPAGQVARGKIIKALYQQWYRSVPQGQARKDLLKAINKWVAALPVTQSGSSSNPFAALPTKG